MLSHCIKSIWGTYGEAGRNLEATDDESGFNPVDPYSFESEILVEAEPGADSVSWNGESRHEVGLLLAY